MESGGGGTLRSFAAPQHVDLIGSGEVLTGLDEQRYQCGDYG